MTVDDEVVGRIDAGLLVLVGVTHDDSPEDAAWLAKKIWNFGYWTATPRRPISGRRSFW